MVKIYTIIFWGFAMLSWGKLTHAHGIEDLISDSEGETDSLFVANYDYEAYLSRVSIFNTKILEKDAKLLDSMSAHSEAFFKTLFTTYFAQRPLSSHDPKELHQYFELGSSLLESSRYISLQIQGDAILQALCLEIESRIEQDQMDMDDSLITKLAAIQYHVNPPVPSDSEKLWHYIETGNIDHILVRLKTRCIYDCANGDCGNLCISFYGLLLLGIVLIVVLGRWWLLRKSKANATS